MFCGSSCIKVYIQPCEAIMAPCRHVLKLEPANKRPAGIEQLCASVGRRVMYTFNWNIQSRFPLRLILVSIRTAFLAGVVISSAALLLLPRKLGKIKSVW